MISAITCKNLQQLRSIFVNALYEWPQPALSNGLLCPMALARLIAPVCLIESACLMVPTSLDVEDIDAGAALSLALGAAV